MHVQYSCRMRSVCVYFINLYNDRTEMSFMCCGGDVGGRERMVPTTCVCNLEAVLLKRYICFFISELVPPFKRWWSLPFSCACGSLIFISATYVLSSSVRFPFCRTVKVRTMYNDFGLPVRWCCSLWMGRTRGREWSESHAVTSSHGLVTLRWSVAFLFEPSRLMSSHQLFFMQHMGSTHLTMESCLFKKQ